MLIAGLIIAVIVLLAALNRVLLTAEKKRPAPGTLINTDHGRVHILKVGQGEDTIVLLPGLGTDVPCADFLPFAKKLTGKGFRCLIVEPLGYGFSDDTSAPRDIDSLISELRTAVHRCGVTEGYILLGHSASGLTIRAWQNRYPDEVRALICEDITLPGQFSVPEFTRMSPAEGPLRVLYAVSRFFGMLGVNRILCHSKEGLKLAADGDGQLLRALYRAFNKSRGSKAVTGEFRVLEDNARAVGKIAPPKCPVLVFTACGRGSGEQVRNSVGFSWKCAHEDFAAECVHGTSCLIDGPHYLHYEHADEMAEKIAEAFSAE